MSSEVIDTMLNLTIFAYIGFLIWLCLRRNP